MKKLAIVIPAFKATYLDAALNSIALQTRKQFNVYIGDDASPEDLQSISMRWEKYLPIVYHRFEFNLGMTDLVAHWHRSIALSKEPWIWLFSDDDLMDAECCDAIFQEIERAHPNVEIFHFNVRIINNLGNLIFEPPDFPATLSIEDFAIKRFSGELSSFAPDYVFSRDAFLRSSGFQSFPRAWCSDDATWIKIAGENGIKTLVGPKISWRASDLNISTNHKLDGLDKLTASLHYIKWLNNYFEGRSKIHWFRPGSEILAYSRNWLYRQSYSLDVYFFEMGWLSVSKLLSNLYRTNILIEFIKLVITDTKLLSKKFFYERYRIF